MTRILPHSQGFKALPQNRNNLGFILYDKIDVSSYWMSLHTWVFPRTGAVLLSEFGFPISNPRNAVAWGVV